MLVAVILQSMYNETDVSVFDEKKEKKKERKINHIKGIDFFNNIQILGCVLKLCQFYRMRICISAYMFLFCYSILGSRGMSRNCFQSRELQLAIIILTSSTHTTYIRMGKR